MKKKLILALMALMILTSACGTTDKNQSSVVNEVAPKISSAKASSIYNGMDAKVEEILNDGSEYAVYLAYPQSSDEVYLYNSQKWRSASMIKVFILATTMEMVKDGNLSLDQQLTLNYYDKVGGAGILGGYPDGSNLSLREVLRLMITQSDNTATNMIIDLVGMDTINDYVREKGYKDTILQREMMDMDAIYSGRENYSSVKDLGNIFLKIYNHKCVSKECDDVMLDFLLGQTDTECFNTALPGLSIAHKTGALAGLFDDGGIIYGGPSGDVILVIMTENFAGESIVIESMKNFARYVVYDFAP